MHNTVFAKRRLLARYPKTLLALAFVFAGGVLPASEPLAPFNNGRWPFHSPRRPEVPSVVQRAWVANPIDAFILHALEAKGLTPSPPADKRTLLRRVCFDLTGLPPTADEQRSFL